MSDETISDQRLEHEKLCARISAGKASQQDAVDAIRKLCLDNERLAVLLGKAKAAIPATDARAEALKEAAAIVMEECWKDREMKLATRIERRILALIPEKQP